MAAWARGCTRRPEPGENEMISCDMLPILRPEFVGPSAEPGLQCCRTELFPSAAPLASPPVRGRVVGTSQADRVRAHHHHAQGISSGRPDRPLSPRLPAGMLVEQPRQPAWPLDPPTMASGEAFKHQVSRILRFPERPPIFLHPRLGDAARESVPCPYHGRVECSAIRSHTGSGVDAGCHRERLSESG